MNEHEEHWEYMKQPDDVRAMLDTLSNLRSLDKSLYTIDIGVCRENGKLVGTIEVREK